MKKRKISIKDINFQVPIQKLFLAMGEDTKRDSIKETPKRFDEAIKVILGGYDREFKDENKLFENNPNYEGIIVLRNIDFFSTCEHHLLPFFGYAHIGYIPSKDKYMGISKLARAVDIYSRRLQTQETLSFQIAEALMKYGKARGVGILIEGRHLCSLARGVEKKSSIMTTCGYYGIFKNNEKLQKQFLDLIQKKDK